MKNILTTLVSLIILASFVSIRPGRGFSGPTDSTSFVTYDTTFIYHYDAYHSFNYYLRITRPTNLFTAGSADTMSRPAFIMMPGQGEMNSNPSSLVAWGPHYFLNAGTWNGGVQLGNGEHFPILITMTCAVNPPEPPIAGNLYILNYLCQHYHIKQRGVHLMGLSEGSFTWCGMIGLTDTTGTGMTGTDIGMRLVTSINPLSGAATSSGNFTEFGHWAKTYGGHSFLTVGYQDAQTTNPPQVAENMEDSVHNSAYFSYNTIDGGQHGSWNTDWDPTLVLWNSVTTPLGTYVTTSTKPNLQGNYTSPMSIFQWCLRQGDTALVVPPVASLSVKKVVTCEYISGMLASDSNLYAIQANGTGLTPWTLPSGEKVKDAAPGFNQFKTVSTVGHYWNSNTYNLANPFTWTQVTTDTTGAGLNDCLAVWAWSTMGIIQRSDSSLWMADNDTMGLIHTLGTSYQIGRPIKISQSGVKYVKVDIGTNGIYGLTSDGKVYLWARSSGTITPTLKWDATGGRMCDIATCSSDMVVGIVRNSSGDTTSGNVYALGASWGDIGGTSVTYSSFTNIMTLLGLTSGTARKVSMNSNSFNVIDNTGKLWAVAKCNSQGEMGNGLEYVNRYNYVGGTYPGIGWSFNNTENPVAAPMLNILSGVKVANVFTNQFVTFYRCALDSSGNLYSWGRNKSLVLGNGWLQNTSDNAAHPNALDVTSATLVTPLTTGITMLDFTAPAPSAGSNQTVGGTSTTLNAGGIPVTLTLHGTPTDTLKYTITGWAWTQESGPNTSTSPNWNVRSPTVANLINGTYLFRVLETDNNGGQDTANMTVTVSQTPPAVSGGGNQAITSPANSVSLSGSATPRSPATSVTYSWAQVSGPVVGTFSNAHISNPTYSGLSSAGNYIVKLTATDNLGNAGSANDTITVNGAVLPAVNAGSDQNINYPTSTATLRGTVTYYGGATGSSVVWTCISHPAGDVPTIVPSGSVTAPVAAISGLATPGTYTFQLTATDSNGNVSADTVNIFWFGTANCNCLTWPFSVHYTH